MTVISCRDIAGALLSRIILRETKKRLISRFISLQNILATETNLEFEKRILDGRFKMTQTLNADSFNQKIMGAAQA